MTVLSRNLIDCLSVFRQAIIPRIETSSNCELLRATLTVLNFGVESLKAKLGLSLSEISPSLEISFVVIFRAAKLHPWKIAANTGVIYGYRNP